MSPPHFKAFCRSIQETLTAYESVFGELAIPEADTRPTKDAAQIEQLVRTTRAAAQAAQASAVNPSSPSPSSNEKKPPSKRSRGAGKAKAKKP